MKLKQFKNFKILSAKQKEKIKGGSLWTGSLAFAVITSTVINIIELFYNIVTNTTSSSSKSSSSSSSYSSSSSSSSIKSSSLSSGSSMTVRLSNTPLKTTAYYSL